MDIIIAIIFGIVQGVTEFVPVSSSGHLLIMHNFISNFTLIDELAFDVALHIGTLLALVIVFRKDCQVYLTAFFSFKTNNQEIKEQRYLARLIFLAIIPAGLAGLFFENIIESVFRSTWVVVFMLVLVSLVFIVVEKNRNKLFVLEMKELKWPQAAFIGCMQVLALVPGTSRSGITIVAGMMTKLKREQAARFSFLLSIPLIFGAGLKKGYDLFNIGVSAAEIPVLLVGMIAAAVVGYLAINFLLSFLSRRSLIPFAVYRLILAGVVVIFLYIN